MVNLFKKMLKIRMKIYPHLFWWILPEGKKLSPKLSGIEPNFGSEGKLPDIDKSLRSWTEHLSRLVEKIIPKAFFN